MKTITYDETTWKLVPIEPTQEMIEAASGYHSLAMALRAAINSAQEAKPCP